jgi:hypothetical protein
LRGRRSGERCGDEAEQRAAMGREGGLGSAATMGGICISNVQREGCRVGGCSRGGRAGRRAGVKGEECRRGLGLVAGV